VDDREPALIRPGQAALKAAGAKAVEFDEKVEGTAGAVAISQMHLAKGLEFRAVAVMPAMTRCCHCRSGSRL
jgi:cysteine synthase